MEEPWSCRSRAVARAGALALIVVTACGGSDVPDEPTWFGDVQPILVSVCGRCHGADPYVPEIAEFRLDRYVAGDANSLDAYDYRDLIVARAVELQAPAMPPDEPLGDGERELLRRWVEAGAPKGTRDNAVPGVELIEPAAGPLTVDQSLELTLRAWDDDGDALVVSIGVRDQGQSGGDVVVSGLGGGMRTVTIDTGQLVSQRRIEVYAVIDDGFSDDPADNQHEVVLLPDVLIDHGARGTAPSVVLLAPNGGDTLFGTTTVSWSASDPDPGDTLTIDLDLIRVEASGESVVASIASGLPNAPSTYPWDTSGVQADDGGVPIAYKVRVTATDAGAQNTRSDSSDQPFTVAAETGQTDYTWTDVAPVFATYCTKCHGQPARLPTLEYFRLDKYDAGDPVPPANGDLGVYEQRSLIYQRLVVAGTMPPAAEPQPSAADVAMIADWILGGAPRDSGPSDGVPTFSWSTPNDAAIATTDASGNITLSWTAADPEGLALTGAISVAPLSVATDALAYCDASVTGWTTVAGADVTAGSFAYTAPAQGYYCFRGEVTDQANQTTTAIAGRPVKFGGPGPPGP